MATQNNTTVSFGGCALGALGLIFTIAKLAGIINWSWWLVLLPFYFGIALAFVIFFGGLFLAGIALLAVCVLEYFANRKWRKNARKTRGY